MLATGATFCYDEIALKRYQDRKGPQINSNSSSTLTLTLSRSTINDKPQYVIQVIQSSIICIIPAITKCPEHHSLHSHSCSPVLSPIFEEAED